MEPDLIYKPPPAGAGWHFGEPGLCQFPNVPRRTHPSPATGSRINFQYGSTPSMHTIPCTPTPMHAHYTPPPNKVALGPCPAYDVGPLLCHTELPDSDRRSRTGELPSRFRELPDRVESFQTWVGELRDTGRELLDPSPGIPGKGPRAPKPGSGIFGVRLGSSPADPQESHTAPATNHTPHPPPKITQHSPGITHNTPKESHTAPLKNHTQHSQESHTAPPRNHTQHPSRITHSTPQESHTAPPKNHTQHP
jgi:hypothetical protein